MEIRGTVRAIIGDTATVAVEGENVPNAGDKAEIFFKLAGIEDEVAVASGSVLKVEADSIQLKIEKATGEVAKDHLVRITSENPQNRSAGSAASPAAADTSGGGKTPAPAGGSRLSAQLAGTWLSFGTDKHIVVFQEDGRVLLKGEQKLSPELRGTFTVDGSRTPVRVEIAFLEVTPSPDASEEQKKAFLKSLEKGDYQGQSLEDHLRSRLVAEFDDRDRMRGRRFTDATKIPSGPLEDFNRILVRSTGSPPKEAEIYEELIASKTRAIEAKPDDGELYSFRAHYYNVRGEYDKAIADASRALTLGLDDPLSTYLLRAEARARKGENAAAIEDLTAAIGLDPDNAFARAMRGMLYMALGKWKEILKDAKAAQAADPSLALGYFLAGCYYAHAGAAEAAEGEWKKALALGWDQEEINQARQQLLPKGAAKFDGRKRKP